MAQSSNSFENRNSYIPPAVQKSMAAHMERVMPSHLKQYQNSGARMPARVEHEMTTQMQKNLPSHMQQYVEPYMHQNVIYGSTGTGSAQLRTEAPRAQAYKPVQTQVVLPNNNSSRRSLRATASPQAPTGDYGQSSGGSPPNSDYEFIMNPNKPPKKPVVDLGGASIFKRVMIVSAGSILIIMLISVVFAFINSAGGAQKEKLIEIAQTQQEIIRVAESAEEKIGDRNLLYKTNNIILTVRSSQQETVKAIASRGEKKPEKRLAGGQNSENDALLIEGEKNGKFDETYQALLQQQLTNYALQLQSAYEGSSPNEKQILEKAFNQIDLFQEKAEAKP